MNATDNEQLTLRDHLAGLALTGLLASDEAEGFPVKDTPEGMPSRAFNRRHTAAKYAETAYILADAMLVARSQVPTQHDPIRQHGPYLTTGGNSEGI